MVIFYVVVVFVVRQCIAWASRKKIQGKPTKETYAPSLITPSCTFFRLNMCVVHIKPFFLPVDIEHSYNTVRADSSSWRDTSSVVTKPRHRYIDLLNSMSLLLPSRLMLLYLLLSHPKPRAGSIPMLWAWACHAPVCSCAMHAFFPSLLDVIVCRHQTDNRFLFGDLDLFRADGFPICKV